MIKLPLWGFRGGNLRELVRWGGPRLEHCETFLLHPHVENPRIEIDESTSSREGIVFLDSVLLGSFGWNKTSSREVFHSPGG